ncbi:conserved hypothetical protein [Microsporum canis CBS 113480]|uniref:Uncharacterized protein n=1 Tax=Arthroderma otae (strain ATCC MYA-4605 / CBS 113480) TaxID=554155 RepID=C5FYM7_ARTOC|nr:conserved hypothetical protein [Microsporum canis CBS 113480]EEQ34625.1 conserved hypothetical protein [Microsporum canis CBS 113480]
MAPACVLLLPFTLRRVSRTVITPTLFQFAELNGIHRACFSRDGTIIDSSARKILEVKDEKPISGYKGHWNLDKSSNNLTLLFKASKSSKFTAFQPLQSYVKAMHNCILQLCDQESFLCLFRIKVGIQLRFNGMITWKPCQRRISWSGLLPSKTSNKMQMSCHAACTPTKPTSRGIPTSSI